MGLDGTIREPFRRSQRFIAVHRKLGRFWLWADEPCASWLARAADRYAGPWNRRTAKSILIVNNTVDPETPYKGAVAMTRYLDRAAAHRGGLRAFGSPEPEP